MVYTRVQKGNNITELTVRLKVKHTTLKLSIYSIAHGLIDAISALIVVSAVMLVNTDMSFVLIYILIYNGIAFGTQFLIGMLADRFLPYKFYAILGLVMGIIALIIFPYSASLSVVIIGLANASYHVGGGAISLNLKPGKAGPPGVFVAPGAIGLLIGTILAKASIFISTILIIITIILLFSIFFLSNDKKPTRTALNKIFLNSKTNKKWKYTWITTYLLLFVIASRSITGSLINYPWKSEQYLLITLIAAIALGKALGGIIADRFGMLKTGVGSLLIALPLILLGYISPVFGILGMFAFNFTMPITLVALTKILRGNNGLAFGLTCLALLIGSIPVITPLKQYADILFPFAVIAIPVSAFVLFVSLKLMSKFHE